MKLDQDKQLKLDFEGKTSGVDGVAATNAKKLRLVYSDRLQARIFNSYAKPSSNSKYDEKLFDGVLRHARSLSW